MNAGKDSLGAAPVAATRPVAAPDLIGLLTPKGGLSATDISKAAPRAAHADASAASAPVAATVAKLSEGAQLLLKLLGTGSTAAASLKAARPLLPEAPTALTEGTPSTTGGTQASHARDATGALIAQALQSGLEHSGLFYESHLADWVAGQRGLDKIRAEPQATLPASHQTSGADMDTPTGSSQTTTAAPTTLASIVHAQLDVIDSGQLRWQGELWPGVPVELCLQRDPHGHDDGHAADDQGQSQASDNEPAGRRWQASLVTTLPSLGKISTRITLQDDHLALALSCAEHTTATALRSAAPALAGTLQATGLTLQAFASDAEQTR